MCNTRTYLDMSVNIPPTARIFASTVGELRDNRCFFAKHRIIIKVNPSKWSEVTNQVKSDRGLEQHKKTWEVSPWLAKHRYNYPNPREESSSRGTTSSSWASNLFFVYASNMPLNLAYHIKNNHESMKLYITGKGYLVLSQLWFDDK